MRQQTTAFLMLLFLACSLAVTPSARAAEILLTHPNGIPAWVQGELGTVEMPAAPGEEASPEEIDAYYAELYEAIEPALRAALGEHMMATGDEDFRLTSAEDGESVVHLTFRQTMSGLPVAGSGFRARVDVETGTILGINGWFYPTLPGYDPGSLRLLSFEDALARALAEMEKEAEALEPSELVFLAGGETLQIAYRALVRFSDGGLPETLYADAEDGRFLQTVPTFLPNVPPWPQFFKSQKFRSYTGLAMQALPPYDYWMLCSDQLAFPLPGWSGLAFIASPCTGDASVSRAHDWAIRIFEYYKKRHQRSSWDGSYGPLESVAHFLDQDVNGNWGTVANAFWDGQRMYYGDGDPSGTQLKDLTLGFDVAAHEMTHGVTQTTSGLVYNKESGALNEAMSDIFAAAAEAWRDGAVSVDTWRIGEDVVGPALAPALRYMDDPTADGYSADYYPQKLYPDPCSPSYWNDYCGVHGNSGIANLAFYLLVAGGSHPTGKTSVVVPAIGMEKAEKIFYQAQLLLNPLDGFAAARLATEQAATALYPADAGAVSLAWDAVGVP